MERKTFAVIGGDKRNVYLAKLLEADGHGVKRYGFSHYEDEVLKESGSLYEAIDGADYCVGPTPCSHNGTDLNAVYTHMKITMDDIFRLMKPEQALIAGYIRDQTLGLANKYGIECIDLLKEDELATLNAIPTAEGAIKLAIEETDFTLHGAHVLVLGYGRIGKILSRILLGMGAITYVAARSRSDVALAISCGHNALTLTELSKYLGRMNIVFNTVPAIQIHRKNMRHLRRDCLLIDLASPPYGIDYNDAKEYGLKVLYSGSLPGKVAPQSTAVYIRDTIYHILEG